MKNNFQVRCQRSVADAILVMSAGVPLKKKGGERQ